MKRRTLIALLLCASIVYGVFYQIELVNIDTTNFSSQYTTIFYLIARPMLCMGLIYFCTVIINNIIINGNGKRLTIDLRLILMLIVVYFVSIIMSNSFDIINSIYGLFYSYQWFFLVGLILYQVIEN